MLNKLEKKVNEKISINEKDIKELKKEYNVNLNQEMLIRNLLENMANIKDAEKKKNILSILIVFFGITSITMTPISLILFIFGIIAYKNEKGIIVDNLEEIMHSDYIGSKREFDLNSELYSTMYKNCIIEDKIKDNNNRINEYKKVKDEINYVKELKNNIQKKDDDYCKQLKDLYQTIPVLAFESAEEYKNYSTYDDEFIKNEIIESKILSKHL